MRTFGLIVCLIGFLFINLSAQNSGQELPLSPEYQRALERKTRLPNGSPGPDYFINHADYKITARLNPVEKRVEGECQLIYYNESSDTLDRIVIRQLQNFYREENPRDLPIREEEYTKGLEISKIELEGKDITPEEISTATVMEIMLEKPLTPSDSVKLFFSYSFDITSSGTARMGTYENNAFFIAYWYPQVSVYDDLYGWDTYPYLGVVEFYQDFSNYDITIQAPRDFLVWGTGVLENPEEVLSEELWDRYQLAQNSDTVIRIVDREYYESEAPLTQDKDWLSWKFKAEHVPDFAFASSDYYYWDGTSLVIDSPERKIWVDACYNPKAGDFKEVAGFAQEILEDLSTEIPGIPYPYPAMTVFNGDLGGAGGGMEFPMIVNDGSSYSAASAFRLTYHEIAHTYFPFYMGINERRFAWMDEGWASFFPGDLSVEKGYENMPMTNNIVMYKNFSGNSKMVPLMTPSFEAPGMSYYIQAYYHPATAYHMLRKLLGDELFIKALRTYMERWAGKHPHPLDFFNTFEDVAGEDLDWFWNPWFYGTGYPDLALTDVKIKNKKVSFVVEKVGDVPIPIALEIEFEDGSTKEEYISARVWSDGQTKYIYENKFEDKVLKVSLGAKDIPDKKKSNNK
jgi:hypothetical protein